MSATKPSPAEEQLEAASMYTNELVIEAQAAKLGDQVSQNSLIADQGRALRLVIFHTGAAIVRAIEGVSK